MVLVQGSWYVQFGSSEQNFPVGVGAFIMAHMDASARAKQFPGLAITVPEEQDTDLNLYPPEAVQVRNTFIHVASPLSEDVWNSRAAVSCPASQMGTLHKAFQDFAFDIAPMQKDIQKDIQDKVHPVHELAGKPVICLENALRFDDVQAPPDLAQPTPNVDLPWPYVEPHFDLEPCYSTEAAPAPAVPTVPAPYEPAPGSTELPSVGSRGHYSGDCKPCSFLYAKGCNNGAMCLFCHLCDRSEKKRRQKAKRAALKGGA